MAEKSGYDKSIDELRAEIAGSRERVGRDLCSDRFGAHAEEENLCGCKKQPQIAKEAGRNRLCVGCVESRRQPGPTGDCRVCKKSTDRFCGKIPPQYIRPMRPTGLRDTLVLGFTRSPGLRNYFLRRQ